jgi:ABC-type bacteriocin/lantibiotic exporter with double-glycine peptidase domain
MSGSWHKASFFLGAKRRAYKYIYIVPAFISLLIIIGCFFHLLWNKPCVPNAAFVNSGERTNDLGCGQAALMTIAQAHNEKMAGKLYCLLTENPRVENSITSFYDLASWSKTIGMKPVGLKIASKDLAQLPMPAIAHTKYNHFLVLMSVDNVQAVVFDQGPVKYIISRHDFEKMFSGYVLCFR